MNAGEVVEHEIERQRVNVVLQLLAERIGQPGEAPHGHAHGEVLALDIGRADMRNIRVAFDAMLAGTDALCGAVAARCSDRRAIELHKLRKVHIAPNAPSTASR